jgi:hypothetical protein
MNLKVFSIACVPVEIRIPYFPNPTRELCLFGWIRQSEKLQALRETTRNLRKADVSSEYKPDFVSLELMRPDTSVK